MRQINGRLRFKSERPSQGHNLPFDLLKCKCLLPDMRQYKSSGILYVKLICLIPFDTTIKEGLVMEEIWKLYFYKYEVSNMGRVRQSETKHILKLNPINTHEYLGVVVYPYEDGKRLKGKMIIVHRAVAELFIPNPNNYPVVNHIDGNKINNCVENLEWCTTLQNNQHAIEIGLSHPFLNFNKAKYGTENGKKLTDEEIKQIRSSFICGDSEFGARPLARKYGVSHPTILEIVKDLPKKEKIKDKFCKICGKEISKYRKKNLCRKCYIEKIKSKPG